MAKEHHGAIDAIVLFPAGIKQDATGKWVSTDLTEEDNKLGAPGGKLRVRAAAFLANDNPGALIIAGGGMGYDTDATKDRPTLARILCDELLSLGVLKERIKLEERSNTTYDGLAELVRLKDDLGFEHIIIVTSRYHVPRLRAMLQTKFPGFSKDVAIDVVAAEDVLIAKDPEHFRMPIKIAYQSAFMLERTKMEQRGVQQINDGTYKFS